MLPDPLLCWYDQNQRQLPWRALPGEPPEPYYVLLSEIMLQQTTVATVRDYFNRFIERWPTLSHLAQASLEEVYYLWQGLGYYSRAKNLHTCAQEIHHRFQGVIPSDLDQLLALPGIGPYTAAAISAIAFEGPTVPVDGNIIRVFSRLRGIETPLPALKQVIFDLVKECVPPTRRGDFAQSLMDLGATICKPKNPLCSQCPLQVFCQAYQKSRMDSAFMPDELPRKMSKKAKPKKYGVVFWYESLDSEVWIRKRPPQGLLANLMEIPGTPWRESPWSLEEALQLAPRSQVSWQETNKTVQHVFTHFHLTLTIVKGRGEEKAGDVTCSFDHLKDYAFPTLMRKVIQEALIP